MNICIVGPLNNATNVDALKNFYEKLAKKCGEFDHSVYLPHKNIEVAPDNSKRELLPEELFELNLKKMSRTDLLVAYVGSSSTDVGIFLTTAFFNHIPIVLIYEEEINLTQIGMTMVIPDAEKITFDGFKGFEDALEKFDLALAIIDLGDRPAKPCSL